MLKWWIVIVIGYLMSYGCGNARKAADSSRSRVESDERAKDLGNKRYIEIQKKAAQEINSNKASQATTSESKKPTPVPKEKLADAWKRFRDAASNLNTEGKNKAVDTLVAFLPTSKKLSFTLMKHWDPKHPETKEYESSTVSKAIKYYFLAKEGQIIKQNKDEEWITSLWGALPAILDQPEKVFEKDVAYLFGSPPSKDWPGYNKVQFFNDNGVWHISVLRVVPLWD